MTVAIVGAAESDLGLTGNSVLGLQTQALLRSLADAGLSLSDVDGLATAGGSRFPATQLADYLGLRPTWTESSMAGGCSFEMHVARAVQAIEARQCSTVAITYGSNQRSARSRQIGGSYDAATPEGQYEAPFSPLYPISYYAMAAQKYLHEYAATKESLAEVAVSAREWALVNPAAFTHDHGPLTYDEVLSSPPVSTPLTVRDCCLVTDGGGAVVLTSLDRARALRPVPVVVLGYGESTTNTSMTTVENILDTGADRSARRAFERAGIGPQDVDVSEIYDSFTITVLLTLEAIGFCGRGEAAALVADGRTRPGGSLPVNTSGGGLAYCHPGMLGLLLLVEAVRQLRGEAGDRQVPGAEVALAHGTGGILSAHATVVLGVDR